MTIVLTTLDGCKVRFQDPDPDLDNQPPLQTYMLPLKDGTGYRNYDFTGSMRDEADIVVRCYEERGLVRRQRSKKVRPDGDNLHDAELAAGDAADFVPTLAPEKTL